MKNKFFIMLLSLIFVLSFAIIPLGFSATTVTLQPSSQDSTIHSAINYGSINNMMVDGGIAYWRSLVQFDLTSIPSNVIVVSATLRLYYYSNQDTALDPVGRIHSVHPLTQEWTEGGVNLATYDGTNPWATSGGDYNPAIFAQATVPASFSWVSWDVTDIAALWIEDHQPNNGFLVKDSTETSGQDVLVRYATKEYSTGSLRPILEITYKPRLSVGGQLQTVNQLQMLMPYLLMGTFVVAGITLIALRLKKNHF